jgi:hypothetical protein
MAFRLCPCGSGHSRSDLKDARGIFVTFVCSACRAEKAKRFRPEVLGDSQYDCDEPVEED